MARCSVRASTNLSPAAARFSWSSFPPIARCSGRPLTQTRSLRSPIQRRHLVDRAGRKPAGACRSDLANDADPIWTRSIAAAPALPRAGGGVSTDLATIYLPDRYTLSGEAGGLKRTSLSRLHLPRAHWLLRNISDYAQRLDRSSRNRDRQKLEDSPDLAHEMRLRECFAK